MKGLPPSAGKKPLTDGPALPSYLTGRQDAAKGCLMRIIRKEYGFNLKWHKSPTLKMLSETRLNGTNMCDTQYRLLQGCTWKTAYNREKRRLFL